MPTILTNVTHEDVLNELLANTCPDRDLDGDWRQFTYDLHCVTAVIEARVVSTYRSIQYEIRKVTLK